MFDGLMSIVITGRLFFGYIEKITTHYITLPSTFNYTNPMNSSRTDLPIHDFYSFFVGIFISYLIINFIYYFWTYSKFVSLALKRRISINSSAGRRPSFIELLLLLWQQNGNFAISVCFRSLYLLTVVGIILPLLAGLLFNVYVIHPVENAFHRVPIVFEFLDWSTGAMGLRMVYNIQMTIPGNYITLMLTRANNSGIATMNILELSKELFMPLIGASLVLLSAPLFTLVIERHFEFPSLYLTSFVLRYGAFALIGAYSFVNFSKKLSKRFSHWLDHLKDDEYLIGKTLENVEL